MRVWEEIQALPRQTVIGAIRVASGILRDPQGRVLIAERTGDGAFAGLWEFPGGKIRDGEDSLTALRRELSEELGIVIREQTLLARVDHEYPDRLVSIDFYLVCDWVNEPEGKDGQALKWIMPEALEAPMMLAADEPVIEALRALSQDQQTLN